MSGTRLKIVRNHTPGFKAEVAFAAIRGLKTLAELAREFDVPEDQIAAWQVQLLEGGAAVFSGDVQAPRVLPQNPFGPDFEHLTLSARVRMAAEKSATVGRSIGAIVLHAGACEAGVEPIGQPLIGDVAIHLRDKLNASDYAGTDGPATISIYVSLINSIEDLQRLPAGSTIMPLTSSIPAVIRNIASARPALPSIRWMAHQRRSCTPSPAPAPARPSPR